jgi:DNA modification methylase
LAFIKNKLKIVNVADLKPYSRNAKKHSDAQIQALVVSIKKNDYYSPICVDGKGEIVIGHGRYLALQAMGEKKVEVVDVSYLKPNEIKKLRILDNKIISDEWDKDILQAEIESIYNGFDDLEKIAGELSITADDLENIKPQIETVGDNDIPDQVKPVTKLGDIWGLGRHRVLCGDSTKEDDVNRLMGGKKANLFFTDPPYSVNYTKKAKEVLKIKQYCEIKNDSLTVEKIKEVLWKPVFKNAFTACCDDACFYLTMPQGGDQMMMMMMMMNENWQVKHELIWVKDSPVFSMGRLDYDYMHEPIAYGWKKNHKFFGKGTYNKSVWNIKRVENKLHPTMKPVELIENAILNSSLSNCYILDLFLGSGSTLIACEKTNRICYGMELDEHYCDVIRDRYIDFCNKNDINHEVKLNGKIWKTSKITQG